jgi:hypothetical protein
MLAGCKSVCDKPEHHQTHVDCFGNLMLLPLKRLNLFSGHARFCFYQPNAPNNDQLFGESRGFF